MYNYFHKQDIQNDESVQLMHEYNKFVYYLVSRSKYKVLDKTLRPDQEEHIIES